MKQQMRGWNRVLITLGFLLAATLFTGLGLARADGDTVDEIKYSFGDTPDSVVFDWRGNEATIYYGADSSYGNQATAAPSAITPTNGIGPFMEAKLSGLQPGSVYHYRIGQSGLDHTFQTIPTGDFNWVDIGDSMSTSCGADGSWMTAQQQLIAAQQPNFVTHGGDIAVPNQCGIGSLHQYFLDQQVWSTGAAFQMALGNHEYGGPSAGAPADAITDNYSNYKGRAYVTHGQTVPNDLPKQVSHPGCGKEIGSTVNTCMGEDWGWFQAGHVLFISYSEPEYNAWPDWQKKADALMASAQANPNVDFIVTWGHRPPYTSSTEGPNLAIRDTLNALAAKYSPTAANPTGKYVLSVGHHAHSMEAFNSINGLTNVIDAAGGQGLTNWVSPVDPNSTFRLMHLGMLSSHYSAASHSLTINFLCGASFKTDSKGKCTYGTVLWSKTFSAVPPVPQPKLQLTYSDGTSSVQSAQQLTYTMTLTNTGTGTASGTSLSAQVPANTTLTSASDDTAAVNGTVTWNTGDLAPNQTVSKQITVLTGTLAGGSTLTSSASAASTDTACQTSGSMCTATDTDSVPLPPPTTREYVTNPSVETNNTGWTGLLNSSCKAVRITTDAHDGRASLEVTRTGTVAGPAGVSAKPNLVTSTVANSSFTGSVWVRAQAPGQSISLQLKETTSAGAAVGNKTVTYTSPDTAWHQISATYTTIGSGNQLAFVVSSPTMNVGGWFHADSMSLIGPQ